MAESNKKKKPLWIYVVILFITLVVSISVSMVPAIQRIELSLRDRFFEIRGPLSVEDSPIVMVAISEKADSEIPEKWPWPSDLHARLIHNLNRAGAKAILFDVIFSQSDTYDPKNDSLFAAAMNTYGNVVLSGDIELIQRNDAVQFNPIFPIPLLRNNNPNPFALVKTTPDLDGFIRSYTFGNNYRDQSIYALALEGVRVFTDSAYVDPLVATEDPFFRVGPFDIIKSSPTHFLINYYGPEGLFPVINYEQVIDDTSYTTVMEAEAFELNLFEDPLTGTGLLYDEVFKDKIVIVGATMPTLQDFHPTPFSTAEQPRPGYEIHAHALQTILDGNYLSRQSNSLNVIIMVLLTLLVIFFNRRFGPAWGFPFMILLMVGYYMLALQIFLHQQIFMYVTGVMITVFFGQVGTVAYEFVNEQREKRRIQGMFSSYVSPTLVNQMIESGEEPKLGGEDSYISAFFSDIVSFSSFSEKLEPKKLVLLINEYLTAMTDIINDQGGTLDKFIGDAIVAFFGAPVPMTDHAYKACLTSQLMDRKLAELRLKWATEDWPDIVPVMQHRMGINTGDMVTGNMGSIRRFNYTMMGDNVNLAARCESGAKQYHVFTMVTEATKMEAEKIGDECLFRLLDNIVVKGRTQPVKVFEIAGLREDADQKKLDAIGIYHQGMDAYFKGDFEAAQRLFKQSEALEWNVQNPSQLFIERCEMMKANPPSDDWDGVFVMTSK